MIAFALILAAAPAQWVPVRLDCLVLSEPAPDQPVTAPAGEDEPSPVTISMRMRGSRIGSVLIDGPPILSSYDALQSYSGTQESDGSIAVAEGRTLARGAQWRGRFRRGAIELLRPSTLITLAPDTNSRGSYSGRWSFDAFVDGHVFMSGRGSIRCTTASQGEG